MSDIRRFVFQVVAANQAPSWFTSAAYGEWFIVPGTTLAEGGTPSNVAAPSNTFAGWNGAAIDQNRKTMVISMPGGHTDDPDPIGTGVWECDFRNSTCAWQRMITGSNAGNHPDDYAVYNSLQRRSDGYPQSTHHYNNTVCDGSGRVWNVGHGGVGNPVVGSTVRWYWDRTQLANGLEGFVQISRTSATWTDTLGHGNGSACYDAVNNRIYSHLRQWASGTGYRVGYWFSPDSPDTYTLLQINSYGHPGAGPSQAHGAKNAIIGFATDYSDNLVKSRVWALNQATAAYTFPTVSGTVPPSNYGCGFAMLRSGNGGNGIVYVWQGYGKRVYRLTLPSDPFAASGYAWSAYDPVGGVTPSGPQLTATGVSVTYGRFNIIEDMGNGEAMLVLINRTTEPVYAMRIPAGGI